MAVDLERMDETSRNINYLTSIKETQHDSFDKRSILELLDMLCWYY